MSASTALSFECVGGQYVAVVNDNTRIRIEPDLDPTPPTDWTDDPSDEEMDLYYNGEVYGIILERRCDKCGAWEVVDSCWGFYGLAWAEEAALDFVPAE